MKCRRKRYPICLFISDGLEIAVRRLKKNAVTGGECIGGMQKTQTEMDGRKKKGEGRYVSDTEKNVWREKGGG